MQFYIKQHTVRARGRKPSSTMRGRRRALGRASLLQRKFHAKAVRTRAIVWSMKRLRQLIRPRRLGAAIAVCLAYLLAIQGLMVSVGVGMSMVPDQTGFIICGSFPVADVGTPASGHQKQSPKSAPECPFCFIASQCAGHVAMAGVSPTLPHYRGNLVAAIVGDTGSDAIILKFRRSGGEPRAPPSFFV